MPARDRELQHVLAHQEHVVLEQRRLHFHAAAGDAALDQRAERGDRGEHAAHDVVDAGAGAQRIAGPSGHVREAAHHLHDLVERRAVVVGPGQESLVAHVDEPRVRLRQRRVVEAVLDHRARLEVLDDDVGARRDPPRDGRAVGMMQVGRDALLVAVEHREEAGAGAEQPPRALAVDRLDLDDLGAHVREDHAARRAHDHVRELDDAQAGERLGKGWRAVAMASRVRHHRACIRPRAAIVFGNPARHSVPCSVSPSSHCARRARSAIRRSKSRFVATPMLPKR